MSATHRKQSALDEVIKVDGAGILMATGGSIPANGGTGYAPGCLYMLTSTFSGDAQRYFNSGTAASATWVAEDLTEASALAGLTATPTELNQLHSGANFVNRVTTTDGVTSGTARVVGGLAYSNTADSTAVTSTATETVFDVSYAIPANTLKAGTVIKLKWQGIVTAANGSDTGIFKAYVATNTTAGSVAGTALTTSSTTDMTASDIIEGEHTIVVRTAGSSGTLVALGGFTKVEAASGTATRVVTMTNSTAVNTQTIQTLCVSCTFNSTNAGNSALLRLMAVEIY